MSPITNKEKQKQYYKRIKADADKRAAYLQKRRDTYKQNKEKGNIKSVSDFSRRDQKALRKDWAERKRKSREKLNLSKETVMVTPIHDETQIAESSGTFSTPCSSQSQKQRGRRIVRKDRATCYLKNKKLTQLLESKIREVNKLKKRLLRSKDQGIQKSKTGMSPKKKVNKMIGKVKIPSEIRDKLIVHEAIAHSIKSTVRTKRSVKDKKKMCEFLSLSAKILKKYKLQSTMFKAFGISKKLLANVSAVKKSPIVEKVKSFYLEDEVSRMANGKKLTITRNKVKMQKRFLNDNLLILHKKFLLQNPNLKVSYTNFTRFRPFWVIAPTEKDRDTCMCKSCENPRLLLEKLLNMNMVNIKYLSDVPRYTTCDVKSKECSYGTCAHCSTKCIPIEIPPIPTEVIVHQWVAKKEEREKLNVQDGSTTKIIVSRSVKEELKMTCDELAEKFQFAAKKYTKHKFNILHQYSQCTALKENLHFFECIIQIDFSENYTLKYTDQIQDAHFGASLQQASLHTGVIHLSNGETVSFCSISQNLQHGPAAIWQHMKPVLELIRSDFPEVSQIHFFSDGPTSQYRQKWNFYLLSKQIYEIGFLNATWNFWESGHGRGAPDGVGGAIKRRADEIVRHGTDLPTAQKLYEKLSESTTCIKLFYISEESILSACKNIVRLKTVPHTMKTHQVITNAPFKIEYRDLSCFCQNPLTLNCPCFKLSKFDFPMPQMEDHIPVEETENGILIPINLTAEEYRLLFPLNQCTEIRSADEHVIPASSPAKTCIQEITNVTSNLVNTWVVVRFESELFAGKVLSVKLETKLLEVSCLAQMSKSNNKFVWPKVKDVMDYSLADIVTSMAEPEILTSGHLVIPTPLWEELKSM